MKEWLAVNWPYLIMAIVYVLERSLAITGNLAGKIRKLVAAISAADSLSMTTAGRDDVKLSGLNHDPDIDLALDKVDPEATPRVSKGKRILRGLLKVLPVVSRFLK